MFVCLGASISGEQDLKSWHMQAVREGPFDCNGEGYDVAQVSCKAISVSVKASNCVWDVIWDEMF